MKKNPSSPFSTSSSTIAGPAASATGGGLSSSSSSSFLTATNPGVKKADKPSSSSSSHGKTGLKRGPWTPEEDSLLSDYIKREGEGKWRTLPKKAGLLRCGKSCRLRWMNYLRPSVKRGHIAPDEEDLILRLHRLLGNRWSLIAGRIPGRTDNEIKNYWNTHLSKKLISQGIDPRTHKPLSTLEPNEGHHQPHSISDKDTSNINRDQPSSSGCPSKRIGYDHYNSNMNDICSAPAASHPPFMQEEDQEGGLLFGGDHMMTDDDNVHGMMSIDHHHHLEGDPDIFSSFLNSLMSGDDDPQDVFNSQNQLLVDLDHNEEHGGDGGNLMFSFGPGWEAPLISSDNDSKEQQSHEQQQDNLAK